MTPLGDNEWVDAAFVLPRDEHCPVLVRLVNGKIEKRRKVEGSWSDVVAWRKLK